MADSQDESDSIGDPTDDGQLTIRIPNPKVYIARQSQWKGRRGKPRCDHCRMNNLKCDRVLPRCNHCSWASGRECKYTPLPTPAHRGIPRCDRCRLMNLKCDRNLPICNHCSEEIDTECNYTPKKRHKVPSEHGTIGDRQIASYGAKTASFLVSDMQSVEDHHAFIRKGILRETSEGHRFYGQNVGSSSQPYETSPSAAAHKHREADSPVRGQQGQLSPDHQRRTRTAHFPLPHIAPKITPPTNHFPFISHSFPSDQGMIITKSQVEFWSHPAFTPLPEAVLLRISNMNSVEMPSRHLFDESLAKFINGLPSELAETAAFSPETYAAITHTIATGNDAILSERLRMWVAYHHVRSGSDSQHLLLVPRDPFFHLESSEEERLRSQYLSRINNHLDSSTTKLMSHTTPKDSLDYDLAISERSTVFERIPVQAQIYDILVYAHRSHSSSPAMLFEMRRIGMASVTWPMVEIFIRLCPLCNLRTKTGGSHGGKFNSSYTSNDIDEVKSLL